MIYHYTTFKGLKGILSSKKIWLTYSQELNDVTDRSYTYMSVIVNLFKSDNEDCTGVRKVDTQIGGLYNNL